MSPEEQAAIVEALVARGNEESDYRAAAFFTAIAHRIDQRIAEIDRDILHARVRLPLRKWNEAA
jgi:hypothetical protein